MACECVSAAGGYAANPDGELTPFTDQAKHIFCFHCTAFWVVVAIVFLLLIGASGRR